MFIGLRYIVKTGTPSRWMPNDPPPWATVYQQTQRWLDRDRGKDGTPRSPNWYIFWYDLERRTRSVSAGTADLDAAKLALDQ